MSINPSITQNHAVPRIVFKKIAFVFFFGAAAATIAFAIFGFPFTR
jgi:hypothetical protein